MKAKFKVHLLIESRRVYTQSLCNPLLLCNGGIMKRCRLSLESLLVDQGVVGMKGGQTRHEKKATSRKDPPDADKTFQCNLVRIKCDAKW
ncbi:hypothetical protein V2J09_016007 [Rumex salicifolius]